MLGVLGGRRRCCDRIRWGALRCEFGGRFGGGRGLGRAEEGGRLRDGCGLLDVGVGEGLGW